MPSAMATAGRRHANRAPCNSIVVQRMLLQASLQMWMNAAVLMGLCFGQACRSSTTDMNSSGCRLRSAVTAVQWITLRAAPLMAPQIQRCHWRCS